MQQCRLGDVLIVSLKTRHAHKQQIRCGVFCDPDFLPGICREAHSACGRAEIGRCKLQGSINVHTLPAPSHAHSPPSKPFAAVRRCSNHDTTAMSHIPVGNPNVYHRTQDGPRRHKTRTDAVCSSYSVWVRKVYEESIFYQETND